MLSGFSRDIRATVDCLEALGAGKTAETDDGLLITPIGSVAKTDARLDCGESGTTASVYAAACGRFGQKTRALLATAGCHKRPIAELAEQLEAHGCKVEGLDISGKLTGGEYALRGDVSSQFISALLLALPLTGQESIIRLTTKLESADYVDMTNRRYGALWHIYPNQRKRLSHTGRALRVAGRV